RESPKSNSVLRKRMKSAHRCRGKVMRWQTEAEMEVVQLQAQVCQGFLETRKKQFDKRIRIFFNCDHYV
ncbi:hypothetical protein LZC04_09400, partial [Campylobacter coli]|uniref:hypothetical protein n=1 Tax=Campylobacter coli TaxID=195 RepID=UPI001F093804